MFFGFLFISIRHLSWVSCSFFLKNTKTLFTKGAFKEKPVKRAFHETLQQEGFCEVSTFQMQNQRNLGHLPISVSPKNAFFQQVSVFKALKPLFFCWSLVFEKCPILCTSGGLTLVGQNWCTLLFHTLKRTKEGKTKELKPLVFCRNLVLRQSLQKPVLLSVVKTKATNWAYCCYRGPKIVL